MPTLTTAARLARLQQNVEETMVQTYGLAHINLAVQDMERALRFYGQVFGLREYGRGEGLVHTRAPGRHDILTFVEDPTTAGAVGGIAHFGFRLVDLSGDCVVEAELTNETNEFPPLDGTLPVRVMGRPGRAVSD